VTEEFVGSGLVGHRARRFYAADDLLATKYLPPVSAQEIIRCIEATRTMAHKAGTYELFRDCFYATSLREEQCDSRETVPVALALFEMMEGDPEKAILRAANFGRD